MGNGKSLMRLPSQSISHAGNAKEHTFKKETRFKRKIHHLSTCLSHRPVVFSPFSPGSIFFPVVFSTVHKEQHIKTSYLRLHVLRCTTTLNTKTSSIIPRLHPQPPPHTNTQENSSSAMPVRMELHCIVRYYVQNTCENFCLL